MNFSSMNRTREFETNVKENAHLGVKTVILGEDKVCLKNSMTGN